MLLPLFFYEKNSYQIVYTNGFCAGNGKKWTKIINHLVQLKMIETVKLFKKERVVKITWFASFLNLGFI